MATMTQFEPAAVAEVERVRFLTAEEMVAIFTGPAVWRERVQAAEPSLVQPTVAVEPEPTEGDEAKRIAVADELRLRGLGKKARRYESCRQMGQPQICELHPAEHRYYEPFRCGLRFCPHCAPFERSRLLRKYLPVVLKVVGDAAGEISEFVMARVTFTVKSSGGVPRPEDVRKMNVCVKRAMRRVLGRRKFGLLFRDEFGFETRGHTASRVSGGLNLHLHGLYFGPFIPWEKVRDAWMVETERAFGEPSRGFYISMVPSWRSNPEQAARHALNHLLKYLSKPPAVSPERIADLEKAVHKVREVHALGVFFGVKVPKEKQGPCLCPACKKAGLDSRLAGEVRATARGMMPVYRSVVELRAAGYRELPTEFEGEDSGSESFESQWFGEGSPP